MPAVLAGSSNLTLAGLSWNRELNLGYPSGQHTGLVIDWFNHLWDESIAFDLAALYEARWKPHAPGVVFLRMLYELYGDGSEAPELRIDLPVTQFQKDGILRAKRILDDLGGVLVCDEVGLGKTFIAGEFIKSVSQRDRQKVLVVVPAALKKSTWDPFLRKYDMISARVELVTYDDVRLGTKRGVRPEDLDDYSLVIIDEAHNLRNASTLTAQAVMDLLWGEHPKKVLLLTATPVNNSLRDLQS
ncbi:helicase domain protein, partial [mine drainage metagenome]